MYVGCSNDVTRRLGQHISDCSNRQLAIWLAILARDAASVQSDALYVVEDEATARVLERSTIMRFAEEGVPLVNRGHGRKQQQRFTEGHLQLRSAFGHDYLAFRRSGIVTWERGARALWNGNAPELRVALALADSHRIALGRWLVHLGPRAPDPVAPPMTRRQLARSYWEPRTSPA